MDRAQFKEQLDLLYGAIVHAMIAYRVGIGILTDNQERLDSINRRHVFFSSIAETSRVSTYVSLSKVFDSNKKSVSLWNVLEHAEQAPTVLAPHILPRPLADIRSILEQDKPLINRIKRVRNRTIAHIETKTSVEETGSTFGEIEQALAIAEDVFERLNYGFCGVPTIYVSVKTDATAQTETVICLVMNCNATDSV